MNNLVYIVGVGRSGTSLLQSMFASHPEVSFLPETAFIRRYVCKGVLAKTFRANGRAGVEQRLNADEVFNRTHLDVSQLVDSIEDVSVDPDMKIYSKMLDKLANNRNWIVDKDPRLIEYLPVLERLRARTHIIHIIRDPRGVLASKKIAKWSKDGHIYKHIFAYRVQMKLALMYKKCIPRTHYHQLFYEDLIKSPEQELGRLCNEIGLDFDQQMLAYNTSAQQLVTQSELEWKKETLGPILENNSGKWAQSLSTKEILLTQLCCKQAFRISEYKPNNEKRISGITDVLWIMSGYILIMLFSPVYILNRKLKVLRICKRIKSPRVE